MEWVLLPGVDAPARARLAVSGRLAPQVWEVER